LNVPHVLVAGKIHQAGLALLRAAASVTFDLVEEVSTESYVPLVNKADAILIRTQPMSAAIIRKAERLKIVSRHGVGFDAIDVEALNQRKIPLTIVGDVNSKSVAEHTMMMMLSLAKRTRDYDAATRTGNWDDRNTFTATELAGKLLLLLGFGRIGQRVARLAAPFDMDIHAYDPFVAVSQMHQIGVTAVLELNATLAKADYVSVHMPFSGGVALIRANELARMKRTAVIINTSRGGLVDEQALKAALDEGRLAGAALDVFSTEPPPPDHPLLLSQQTTLSPHVAGLTQECAVRMSEAAVRNILNFFAGTLDLRLVVNAAKIALTKADSGHIET
jgi:D-3-phosphoglycerate dehydrogenase